MPRLFKDHYFSYNSVNLSGFVREAELSYEADEKDATVMTDNSMIAFPGLLKWRYRAKLLQSFASSEVDQTLFAEVGSTTARAVEFRPTSSSVSATNPKYTGTGYLMKYPPLAGGVGDLHETDIEIAAASDLTRATS